MKVAVFSTRSYDRDFLAAANREAGSPLDLIFHEAHLAGSTAKLAEGAESVCAFVNDELDSEALTRLAGYGVRLVALRCAGFNNVDLEAAGRLDIAVARVPSYSPEAVAEHTTALILTLNRKIHRAYARTREGNFALDGLLGFNLASRTIGIVGLGQIGLALARIMTGFGMRVLATDPLPRSDFESLGGRYVALNELLASADIVSLHCPLTPATRHLISSDAIGAMKQGVMLVNTSRGAVIDTPAVIEGLKSGKIGYFGLDVYEEEEGLFFEDLSEGIIQDDVFARLLTFPNVVVTGHQAFFTGEALSAIARTTIANITSFADSGQPVHPVGAPTRRSAAR